MCYQKPYPRKEPGEQGKEFIDGRAERSGGVTASGLAGPRVCAMWLELVSLFPGPCLCALASSRDCCLASSQVQIQQEISTCAFPVSSVQALDLLSWVICPFLNQLATAPRSSKEDHGVLPELGKTDDEFSKQERPLHTPSGPGPGPGSGRWLLGSKSTFPGNAKARAQTFPQLPTVTAAPRDVLIRRQAWAEGREQGHTPSLPEGCRHLCISHPRNPETLPQARGQNNPLSLTPPRATFL